MCGIAGFYVREIGRTAFNPTAFAAELLLGIDHRGGDATGYAAFTDDGAVQMQKAACEVKPFLTGMRSLPRNTQTVLLHTRLATQGKPAFPENNHPVTHGSTYVVHNGHINNDSALFGRIGVSRMGYVDSEIIPAMIAREGWENIGTALGQLDGAYAIAAVDENRPGELVLAKGEWSPLVYFESENLIAWASEERALRTAWRAAVGTPPRRAVSMWSGDILRVTSDGRVLREEFEPMVMKHWTKYVSSSSTSTKSVPARTMSESSCLTPLMPGTSELRTALSELENRKPGAVEVADSEQTKLALITILSHYSHGDKDMDAAMMILSERHSDGLKVMIHRYSGDYNHP